MILGIGTIVSDAPSQTGATAGLAGADMQWYGVGSATHTTAKSFDFLKFVLRLGLLHSNPSDVGKLKIANINEQLE